MCAPFKALQPSQKAFPKEVTPKPRPQGLDGVTEESILARRKNTREVPEAREQNEPRNSTQVRSAEAESGNEWGNELRADQEGLYFPAWIFELLSRKQQIVTKESKSGKYMMRSAF